MLGVVVVILPVTLRRTPEEYLSLAVALLAVMAVASLAAWAVRDLLSRQARRMVAWGLILLGAVALPMVAYLAVPERPEHALPFAAGVAVSIAPVRRVRLRLPVQVLAVAAMAALLLAAGRSVPEAALAVLLLVYVVWLSGVLARFLLDARRRQLEARVAAERRAEMLSAVRELSGQDATDAARTVTRTLRTLGFDVAGVSLERDGLLVPLALEGVPPAPELRIGEGLSGTAVAEDRRIVVEQHDHDDRGLPGREGIRSALAVPVRVAGRPVGVLVGGRELSGPFPDDVVEVADVLASHFGGVLETEQRLSRQRELLDRMQALEEMRAGLVTAVSEEVRDPLTVVRGIAETLVAHGDRLPTDRRIDLLQGFEDQARALHDTIDALLDFSRLQASRPDPIPGLVNLGDVLMFGEDVVEGDPDVVVRIDPDVLYRTLELVNGLGPVRRLQVVRAGPLVELRLHTDLRPSGSRTRLLLGQAERVILSVGGTWRREHGVLVMGLPREAQPATEGRSA